VCNGKHHTLLHDESFNQHAKTSAANEEKSEPTKSSSNENEKTVCCYNIPKCDPKFILLPSATIQFQVVDVKGVA